MNERTRIKFRLIGGLLLGWAMVCSASASATSSASVPWKFGVMSDTQWTCSSDPEGMNPNAVAVSIINQINTRFISEGVKFVIQVGDLTENGADADIAVRADAARELYQHGIGFFPMRGNHETYTSGNSYGIPALQANFPQTQCQGAHTFGVTDCNSPTLAGSYPDDLKGMSYTFDYGDEGNQARFLIIDDWITPNKSVSAAGYPYGYSISEQQSWINDRLNGVTRGTEHAFVFSHQNLMGENHQDCLFQGYTNANPDMQNAFFASLQNNGVRYYICGHDHIHQRSLIASPDGLSTVQELIGASNSSKFYTPKSPADSKWYAQKVRETSLSQEMYTVGYYIFTVDGPRVTVDYYADDHGSWLSDDSYPSGPSGAGTRITPTFNFIKKETWGYSLNGKEILVPQGRSYVLTDDTSRAVANGEAGYVGTTAKILKGTNGSSAKDANNRALTKAVDTGWAPKPSISGAASDVYTLWGMTDLGGNKTDTYVLSMTIDPSVDLSITRQNQGHLTVLAALTRAADGTWADPVAAVDKNVGGRKKFVRGPWNKAYPLGTCGVDPVARTAWAVVNTTGDFAVFEMAR